MIPPVLLGYPQDPLIANVGLLLHCDGSNGSTTFTDTSRVPNAVTPTSATVATAQSVFGGASARFPGTSSRLDMPTSVALAFGSGDMTLEMFFRYDTGAGTGVLVDLRGGSVSFPVIYLVSGVLHFNTNSVDTAGTATAAANTWYYLAWVRSSGVSKVFVGAVGGSTSQDISVSDGANVSSAPFRFGYSYNGNTPFTGYMDEVRLTKGVARYSSAPSIPVLAFPDA